MSFQPFHDETHTKRVALHQQQPGEGQNEWNEQQEKNDYQYEWFIVSISLYLCQHTQNYNTMSNPPTNNITTIPESPPPPPLPLLRRHSNPPPPHLEDPRQQFVAASNKYTTPSPSMVTTKLPIPPEARQDASYEPRTPPQEHRSLVSKDSHTNPGETNMMRQSLSWSSPTGRNLGKTSGSMDLASPVNGVGQSLRKIIL